MTTIEQYLKNITLPDPNSHKGQNGKLLIIGGSHLFHAASKWSLDVASKFVDMVFYSSVPSNNALVEEAKAGFWNGIIVERPHLEDYLEEAEAILIGPGMERHEAGPQDFTTPPTEEEWNTNTQKIVNYLLHKYPTKKWVVDAGALQMVAPELLTNTTIITPHKQELERVLGNMKRDGLETDSDTERLQKLLSQGVTILLKSPTDLIYHASEMVEVSGGNPGMTKGGTGDTLAGLVAALYTKHNAMTAAVVGSYINKQAGEFLAQTVGPFFSASDLVQAVPTVLWRKMQSLHNLQK